MNKQTTSATRQRPHATALLLVLAAFAGATAPEAAADETQFLRADQAAQDQRFADMQRIYEQVLQAQPGNVRALTGRAAAQAWQGDFSAAQDSYARAIAIEPKNIDAQVGLGYAFAWAGQYTEAHTAFGHALRIDPMDLGARKGIAYSYYWAGEHELALQAFDIAQSLAPNDAEIIEAVGRVNLSRGRSRDAVRYFDTALQIDPQRDSARLARRSAYLSAPELEMSTRVGSTSGVGSGLRSFELAHWASPTTRFAARYDNSLGLDNASIADRGEDAPGYFLSAQQRVHERWTASVELGRRDLAAGYQNIVTAQGVYSASRASYRLGAQVGNHPAGHTDRLLFGGVNLPVRDRWRLEPVFYVSQSGADSDDEWRGVVNLEYASPSVWTFGGFAGAGQISASNPAFDGSIVLLGAWANLLVSDRHTVHLLLRREESPTANITVAELGFTYRVPGN